MSSLKIDLIEQTLLKFCSTLDSSIPLTHFKDFYDETKVTEVTQTERGKTIVEFVTKISILDDDSILANVKELGLGIRTKINNCVSKNQAHRTQSVSFMEKRIAILFEDFKTSVDVKLLSDPCMEMKDLEIFLENSKLHVVNLYENFWKPGDAHFQEEKKSTLEDQIETFSKEIRENQRHYLGKILFKKLDAILSEMSRQVECFIGKSADPVSKQPLLEKVDEIMDCLAGKGNSLDAKHRKKYSKIVETIEEAKKCLIEAKETMPIREATKWTDLLVGQLRTHCSNDFARYSELEMKSEENVLEITSTELISANGFEDMTSVESNIQDDSDRSQNSNASFPVVLPEKPSFMISTFKDEEKALMEKSIEGLGGCVSSLPFFDIDCDAIIVRTLFRGEKLLGSIASGKYILKPEYIKRSQETGRFLPIDKEFLWHEENVNDEKERYLARASFSWCTTQMRDKLRKPMTGIRVFVIEQDKTKEAAYMRLISAAGGVIVNSMDEATMIIKDEKCSVQTPPGTEVKSAMVINHLIFKLPNYQSPL